MRFQNDSHLPSKLTKLTKLTKYEWSRHLLWGFNSFIGA